MLILEKQGCLAIIVVLSANPVAQLLVIYPVKELAGGDTYQRHHQQARKYSHRSRGRGYSVSYTSSLRSEKPVI